MFWISQTQQISFLKALSKVELLIGTRESLDSRVQGGLASPSPLQRVLGAGFGLPSQVKYKLGEWG